MQLTWQREQINLLFPIALICCCLLIDVATAQEAQQPWYENLPAVAMDYKVGAPLLPLEGSSYWMFERVSSFGCVNIGQMVVEH